MDRSGTHVSVLDAGMFIFFVVDIPIVLFTMRFLSLRRTKVFVKSAASATGTVTSVEKTTVTAHHVPVWITTVKFLTGGDQQSEVKFYNDRSQGEAGDTVRVLYPVAAPQNAKIDDGSLWSDGLAEMIVGIVWTVFGLIFGSITVWALYLQPHHH